METQQKSIENLSEEFKLALLSGIDCKKVAIEFAEFVLLNYPNQRKKLTNPAERGFYTIEELFTKFLEDYGK